MPNSFGVDVAYFKKELSALSRSLDNRTPEELQRYLLRLAEVAIPQVHKICPYKIFYKTHVGDEYIDTCLKCGVEKDKHNLPPKQKKDC